jgi:predicted nucleic acid-binding protein
MIVVDASAVLDVLLETPRTVPVQRRLFRSRETIVAPHLIDIEVVQVLRRYQASGQLDEKRSIEAIDDYLALPIERYPHLQLLNRMWEVRQTLTAYDATYVALAELLGARLLTTDARLARSVAARKVAELIQ